MAKRTFDQALNTFSRSIKTSMTAARECSNLAIEAFAEHGDLSLAQRFFDAMPNNYVRKTAFVEWMAHFSPVTFEKGKFTKDKSDDAIEFDVPHAMLSAFWEWKPDAALALLLKDDDAFKKAMAFVNYVRKDKVKASAHVEKLADGIEALVVDAQHAAAEAIN